MFHYQKIQFLTSAALISQCPEDTGAEVAFAGRSNAGKSSAINTLTNITGLAKTSKTPGRTQLLNFFSLDDTHRIVDLPGYGYAHTASRNRQRWSKTIDAYLTTRKALKGLVLVMDSRHPFKPFDEQVIEWCLSIELPFHILLTKVDKLKQKEVQQLKNQFTNRFDPDDPLASWQLFSSLKKQGVDVLRQRLDAWLEP